MQNKRSFLLLTMMILGTACSQHSSSPKTLTSAAVGIIGGQDATKADLNKPMFSSTVAVSWSDDESGRDIVCSGTLIAPDLVLTASHCLKDVPNTEDIQISFRSLNLRNFDPEATLMIAKKYVTNKNYIADAKHRFDDIALVLLPRNAPQGAQVATLATATEAYYLKGSVLGYGRSNDAKDMELDLRNGSDQFRSVSVGNIIMLDHDTSDVSGMLALSQGVRGICMGDSGGPLYALDSGSPVLVGITQLALPSDDGSHLCAGFSFFVNVADHADWIKTESAELRK